MNFRENCVTKRQVKNFDNYLFLMKQFLLERFNNVFNFAFVTLYLLIGKQMNQEPQNQKILGLKRDHLAIILMIVGPISYTLGFIYSNQHKLHPASTGLVRGITVSLVTYLIGWFKGIDLTFPSPHNFKWQLVRNNIMILQGLVYAWSMFYLPLPIAVTIQSSSPIFASIFDRVLNGIRLNKAQTIWLIIAFTGVILTANGNYFTYLMTGVNIQKQSSFENYMSKDPLMMLWAALALTVTHMIHGYGVVITKKLKQTNSIQVNYVQGLLIAFSSAILIPFAYNDPAYHHPTIYQFGQSMIFAGIPLTIGQLFFVGALLICHDYGMLTPFMFTAIIFGYLISVIRYGEAINVLCLIGAVAIALGVVFIVRCKNKTS